MRVDADITLSAGSCAFHDNVQRWLTLTNFADKRIRAVEHGAPETARVCLDHKQINQAEPAALDEFLEDGWIGEKEGGSGWPGGTY